jgi:hypothetical protein
MRDVKTHASIASHILEVALRALGTHRAWNARSTMPHSLYFLDTPRAESYSWPVVHGSKQGARTINKNTIIQKS